jgi:catechol 2,3-dioxygenase-like lactoylglutathione lyase family enzyme
MGGKLKLFLALLGSACASALAESPPLVALEHVTLFVRDYDEALRWYVELLGLVKVEDRRFGAQRWVTLATAPEATTHIVLAVPIEELRASIGHQHNWVFRIADCASIHTLLIERGVKFIAEPQHLPWGCQAIIQDLYGNHIVLRAPARADSH